MLPTYRSFTGCLRVSAMKLYLRVSAMTPIQGLIAPYYFDRPTWDMRKESENQHIGRARDGVMVVPTLPRPPPGVRLRLRYLSVSSPALRRPLVNK